MKKKNVTIKDIAKHAKVSKSTVSRVLNDTTPVAEEKRIAVLEAMKTMNFEPNIFAQGLASGQTKTIGVMTQNIGSPIYDAISQGILFSLTKTSYSAIFADGKWETQAGKAAIDTLQSRKVDGMIVVGSTLESEELEPLKDQLPTIIVGREIPGWENHCLFIDNELAAFEATRHLIDLGHQKIAHIAGIANHQDSIRRQAGFRRAMKEANIPVDERLVCDGDFDGCSGVMAVEKLLASGSRFTAIFAANDMTAYGARLALYRRGIRVPEEVSIIGFDDQAESAFFTPPLTTVRQPAKEMGIDAAQAMVNLINKRPYTLSSMATEVIVRESTRMRT